MGRSIFTLFFPSSDKKALKLKQKINRLENYISIHQYKIKQLEERLAVIMEKINKETP